MIDGLCQAVVHTRQKLNTSECRTCLVLGMSRSSFRYQARSNNDEELRLAIIRLAKQYGRYGYRKVTALLRMEGWQVNHKKVERLWTEEGFKSPRGTRNDDGFIIKTVQSSGFGPLIQTTFGLSTSCMINSAMVAAIKCSQSWMNILVKPYP